MSISIENLQIGCTGAQLVAKINEIISALNGVEQTTSYESLLDKPSINGVVLSGNKSTVNLNMALSDISGYTALVNSLATKQGLTEILSQAIEEASAAARSELSSKIDVSHTNVVESTMLNDAAYIYVIAPEGLRKITIANLCKNVALETLGKGAMVTTVSSQLVVLNIIGIQDGENDTFRVGAKYVRGTSHLFFNGQRLVEGTDYTEDTAGFTMLTCIPEEKDSLVFIAAV